MIEIRFHGLGGQGAVVASKFLAEAAAESGFKSQSFASYGALRRGGKVESYVRISGDQVILHCKMYTPDWLVFMDESFASDESAIGGLKKKGKVLINTNKSGSDYPLLKEYDVFTVDASKIANDKGLFIPGGMPVINTTLLGALIGMLGEVQMEHLIEVIKKGTPKPEVNIKCAIEGFEKIRSSGSDDTLKCLSQEDNLQGRIPTKRCPMHNPEKMKKCHRCQICYMVCPTLAIRFYGEPIRFSVQRDLCNNCGICIEECPRNAIGWEGG